MITLGFVPAIQGNAHYILLESIRNKDRPGSNRHAGKRSFRLWRRFEKRALQEWVLILIVWGSLPQNSAALQQLTEQVPKGRTIVERNYANRYARGASIKR